jgi:hypothetical protein
MEACSIIYAVGICLHIWLIDLDKHILYMSHADWVSLNLMTGFHWAYRPENLSLTDLEMNSGRPRGIPINWKPYFAARCADGRDLQGTSLCLVWRSVGDVIWMGDDVFCFDSEVQVVLLEPNYLLANLLLRY